MHRFIYNGKNSRDLGLVLSGEDVWKSAVPDLEFKSIPGRNGDLLISNNRFSNVEITYHVGVKRGFPLKYSGLMNFLLSDPGYHRLEDSYHPEHFRMGVFASDVNPQLGALNQSGTFDLTFNCKPQKFLKQGERAVVFTENGSIYNPTLFSSKPLIRVYGAGEVTIGQNSFRLTENNEFCDVDCDLQDACHGAENRNGTLVLTVGDFPVLKPGENVVVLGTGITKLEITPRWWCL
ncbi:MAG: hypothetical protein IJV40_06300 [Oscillospiraceae bacterium]|nr:hypothetical protein [Oscillospiraceae bacterium]